MESRKRSPVWLERMAPGLLLLAFVLGCGFLAQVTAKSPATSIALNARAAR